MKLQCSEQGDGRGDIQYWASPAGVQDISPDPAVELLIHNLSTEWRGILVRQLGEEFGNFSSPSPYNLGLGSSPRVISKMLIIHPS